MLPPGRRHRNRGPPTPAGRGPPLKTLAAGMVPPYMHTVSLRRPDVFRLVTPTRPLYSLDFAALNTARARCAGIYNYLKENDIMTSGTVKWFNPVKGFGFITPDDGTKDAFVHISAVERAGLAGLNEGQKIEYELQRGQNGKSSAENLKVAD